MTDEIEAEYAEQEKEDLQRLFPFLPFDQVRGGSIGSHLALDFFLLRKLLTNGEGRYIIRLLVELLEKLDQGGVYEKPIPLPK